MTLRSLLIYRVVDSLGLPDLVNSSVICAVKQTMQFRGRITRLEWPMANQCSADQPSEQPRSILSGLEPPCVEPRAQPSEMETHAVQWAAH